MRPSRKLIIHIGSHKTGTTSIQLALKKNKNQLAKRGLTFFHMTVAGGINTKGASNGWIHFDRDTLVSSFIIPGLSENLAQMQGDVVISAENFSWVFSEEEIRSLKAGLNEYFEEILVIAYLRRQDQQVLSHYQQGSTSMSSPALCFYGSEMGGLPEHRNHFDCYLDYNSRIGSWGKVFGDDNLVLRVFERDQLKGGDVVVDFFDLLDVDLVHHPELQNLSRGFEKTKLGHLMNRAGVLPAVRRRIIPTLESSRPYLPSRGQALDFYARYRESNRLLNERFGINDKTYLFDENFDKYPEKSNLEWTEAEANKVITSILNAVRHPPCLQKDEINLVVKLAMEAKTEQPDRAYRLLKIAQKFRPNGPLIKKEIAKLESRMSVSVREGSKEYG